VTGKAVESLTAGTDRLSEVEDRINYQEIGSSREPRSHNINTVTHYKYNIHALISNHRLTFETSIKQ